MADTVSITSSKVLSLKRMEYRFRNCEWRVLSRSQIKVTEEEDGILLTRQNDQPGLLGEDDEHASLLVEDPLELLVQDHLTQLLLHLKRKTISIKVQGCHEFSSDYPKHY